MSHLKLILRMQNGATFKVASIPSKFGLKKKLLISGKELNFTMVPILTCMLNPLLPVNCVKFIIYY
ncbi:hypothetical protein BpHYR1_043996 [Brachionus plicatilis]|uniref:Uncharacterized protein n=1 Tax=Brachionus plicatilis TaxID=10195 RepID=A0A3M7QTB3_BRAPC|nr:hypothetical protein BpHYR1_043996 [Brachionus plicatilis]